MTEFSALPARRLTTKALACRRGDRLLFGGIDLDIGPGEALVLTGPNGAGKSSLLMCLAGLIASEGEIGWHGRDEDERPGADIHLLSHLPALKPGLGVGDNLRFWTDLNGGDRSLIAPALEAARLGHATRLRAGLLSAGQTRRLSLCRLLVAPRPVWLLDEPTSALDKQGDAWVTGLIDAHLAAGGLAVIATHLPLALAAKTWALALGEAA